MTSNSWDNVPTKDYWRDPKRVERMKVGKFKTINDLIVKKSRHLGDKKVVQEPITRRKDMKAAEKKNALNLIEVLNTGFSLVERFDNICTKSAEKYQGLTERSLELRTKLLGAEYVKECEQTGNDLITAVGKKTCELLSPIAETLVKNAVRSLERKDEEEELRHRKEMEFLRSSYYDGDVFIVSTKETKED